MALATSTPHSNQQHYFKSPPQLSDLTRSSRSLKASHTLRIFLAARNLPEPDSRSRTCFAQIYHAQESPFVPNQKSPHTSAISDVSDEPSSPPPPTRHTSWGERRSQRRAERILKRVHAEALVREAAPGKSRTAVRAPSIVTPLAAPDIPTSFLAADGTPMVRTAWSKLSRTEVARKSGRDVEFARPFCFQYLPGSNQVIRVAFFDCTRSDPDKHRLIATADFKVGIVAAAKGKPVEFNLKFLPCNDKDCRRTSWLRKGSLMATAEEVRNVPIKYRFDVECNSIVRARSMSSGYVKRSFYTVHAIFDADEDSDLWTLIFRSDPVEMIKKKRDGGSMNYNYFSSRKLKAAPGAIVSDKDAKSKGVNIWQRAVAGLKSQSRDQFFSLPGCDLLLTRDDLRLKISLFEDNGTVGGYDLIASTNFTVADMKKRAIGSTSPIKLQASAVGKAVLKYVECTDDPHYFCLSLVLHGL